jgi:TetR/AcrR family hemagglutinin/protease transcriptional regulator
MAHASSRAVAAKVANPARRRLSPAARRAQLLDCALAVFAERGLGRAGHAPVAEAAGVSVPTVFHYFPTREALVDAVLDQVEDYFITLARDTYRGAGSAAERLVAHGLAFLAAVDSHPNHIRVWLDWSTAIREHVWPRYLAFQERLIALVAEAIEDGRAGGELPARVEPESAARLFVGNAHMAAVMSFAPTSGIDLPGHVRQAVATLLASDRG